MTDHEPPVAPGIPLNEDMPEDDSLLGVPFTALLSVRAMRGLALLGIALLILLWPDRTDRVVGRLLGVALVVYAVAAVVTVVRDRDRRTFWRVLSIGLGLGAGAALLVDPADSVISATRLTGGLLVAGAVVDLVTAALRRRLDAWRVSRSGGLALGGTLLIAYPDALLTTATSVAAGVLAATGLIQVFTPSGTDGDGEGLGSSLLGWVRRRPDTTEDRSTLQQKLYFEGPGSAIRFARFLALMVFASIIAAMGVVVESTAVVIGAMLIAPLMVPLMGTALSAGMGWPRRMRRSLSIAGTGMTLSIATGALIGAVLPRTVDVTTNTEVLARIAPTTVDLAIAVAAGAAGAYALGRRDVSDSLPGVAVAIALVPPLTVVGLCWQQGAWQQGNGALLLFLTNAVAILLAGGTVFVLIGVVPTGRISEAQERVSTAAVGLLAVGALVVLLLLLNGSNLAQAELARAGVDEVLTDWTNEHEDFLVVGRRLLGDGTYVFDLAGPGRPPELEALVDDLEDAVADGAEVRVTWVDQEQVTGGGGD
jgi:uncharacterized hydrophobic protein (TIGR00271 family)